MHQQCHHPLYVRTTSITGKTETQIQEQTYAGGKNGRPNKNRPDNSKIIISALLYADDVALIGSSEDMKKLLQTAEQYSRDLGY